MATLVDSSGTRQVDTRLVLGFYGAPMVGVSFQRAAHRMDKAHELVRAGANRGGAEAIRPADRIEVFLRQDAHVCEGHEEHRLRSLHVINERIIIRGSCGSIVPL